jgi:hypothetical protein
MGAGAVGGNLWRAGLGGALYHLSGTTLVEHVTFASNQATGFAGGMSLGANVYVTTGAVVLANSILAHSVGSSNCFGNLTDGGHNISSDASCAFAGPGSLNSTDPKLGPLADNGGPTLTMALLYGSPAINTGDPAGCPLTDQRDVSRPQGPRCDVGAFESSLLSVFILPNGQLRVTYDTSPGRSWILQESENFTSWMDVETGIAGLDGVVVFDVARSAAGQFFRASGN